VAKSRLPASPVFNSAAPSETRSDLVYLDPANHLGRLPEPLQLVCLTLPAFVSRRAGAAAVSRHLYHVSHRSLERWPLPTRRANGRAVVQTAELFCIAYERLNGAPATRSGRHQPAAETTGRAPPPQWGVEQTRVLAPAAANEHDVRSGAVPSGDPDLSARASEAPRRSTAGRRYQAVTLREATEKYIAAHAPGWRSELNANYWRVSFKTYVYPAVGELPVDAVETSHVLQVIEPIWMTKAPTAARLRGRLEAVLDFAKFHGWRTGENPARWKGHLQNALPPVRRIAVVAHFPALPWEEVASFLAALEQHRGAGALALRFTILTAARTNEVLGATWREVDLPNAVWTVPALRMKAGREHRVPLSEPALAVLREAARLRLIVAPDAPMFVGRNRGDRVAELSKPMMREVLLRMGRRDVTVHGFRSTFRDWAAETTSHEGDVVEAALAHTIHNRVEAAYRRGDLFEKRRRLMTDWGEFCMRTRGIASIAPNALDTAAP
jgi:integrase